MSRTYNQIPPPESAISSHTAPAGACGVIPGSTSIPDNPTTVSLVSVDLAADAAALEACQVSAMLAAGMLSLTNLKPDAMPRLLHRS